MIRLDSFDIGQDIQKAGAVGRIAKIFSAQLGQTSGGLNSFFYRICEEILRNPDGFMLKDMRCFETKFQTCQMSYEGGMGWDERSWPLL